MSITYNNESTLTMTHLNYIYFQTILELFVSAVFYKMRFDVFHVIYKIIHMKMQACFDNGKLELKKCKIY